MTENMPAISVSDLTRRFGDLVAVDRLTFSVKRGELFGLVGPDGAGKTTALRMLAGVLKPTSGDAIMNGISVVQDPERVKHEIAYMSQLFSLYGDLTVEENITFFSGLNSVPWRRRAERRDWVLEMAGLREHRKRLTRDLPLGWKQRLALGCAVLHEPPILFLDEPTSGVDPISRRRFWDLIYALADEGITVFVSTHYMEEAEYCYRLALMNRGRLIALDTPMRLRAAMREPILEISTDSIPKAIEVLQGQPGIIEAALFGRAVHVTVQNIAQAPAFIPALLKSQGITVHDIKEISPSLEDVFVSLIRAEGGAVLG